MGLRVQAGGVTTPPTIFAQPQDADWWVGREGALSVIASDVESYQWQHGDGTTFTNVPGATTNTLHFSSVQMANDGVYRVVLSNVIGTATSSNAIVTVHSPSDYFSLSEIWNAAPGTQSYVTSTGGSATPSERVIAYNSLSNQLYVVHRNGSGLAVGTYDVFVLNPTNGAILYTLNTNGVAHDGTAPGGTSFLALNAIGVADDGAIYISSLSPDSCSCTTANGYFRLYRWANSHPNTEPVLVFQGDPAGATISRRWGDTMSVRGSGINTEIILDANQGTHAAILKPLDASMTVFTNYSLTTTNASTPIGRSLQFGDGETMLHKRAGADLFLSSYDVTNQSVTVVSNYIGFPLTLAGVAVQLSDRLAVGVDHTGITGLTPDTVNLYDISDPGMPLLINKYSFPGTKQNNANFISQTIVAGNRVFSINANNGIVAFDLVPPGVPLPILQFAKTASSVTLSWSDPNALLQSTPSLVSPIAWTTVSAPGETNSVQNISGAARFFRLIK